MWYITSLSHVYHFIVDISTLMSVPGGDCRKLEPSGLRDGAEMIIVNIIHFWRSKHGISCHYHTYIDNFIVDVLNR